jgi:hypothetical protein
MRAWRCLWLAYCGGQIALVGIQSRSRFRDNHYTLSRFQSHKTRRMFASPDDKPRSGTLGRDGGDGSSYVLRRHSFGW